MIVRFVLASAIGLSLANCAAKPLAPTLGAWQPQEYTLSTGDKVRITTFGFEDLSGEFLVSADESIAFPSLGAVKVGGRTPDQVSTVLTALLTDRQIVRAPRLSTEVIAYRPFNILGEVSKPGQYPFTSGLTVLNAVAVASGFTYRANTKRVFIRHAGTNSEEEVVIGAATPVQPGDTIRVVERLF
ncbi:polysaccharide biosynthesis/export family protein [Sphingomonas aracearum]|nr:polysaccharide biosynthesis/export family protein [Sphingomonas aracearum]